jgi:hypothetical protein
VPCSDGFGFVAFRYRVGTGLSKTMRFSVLVYHALDLMLQIDRFAGISEPIPLGRAVGELRQWQRSSLAASDPSSVSVASAAGGLSSPERSRPAVAGRRGRACCAHQSGRPAENEVSATWASFPALGNLFRDAGDLRAPTRSKTASGCQAWVRSTDSEMRPTQVAVRSRVSADAKSRFQSGGTSGSSA